MTTYDEAFFDSINEAGPRSASAVLPLVVQLVRPASAVDVGCGTGVWSVELLKLGVDDVLGLDGPYVPRAKRQLDEARFREVDLRTRLDLGRRFDLALCLEVGEHLDAANSETLVDTLVDNARAVLFSAAAPGQGGTGHVNEQWPEYWVRRFEDRGWRCWDILRPILRDNRDVAWIYRQNLLLMLPEGHPVGRGLREEDRLRVPQAGDISFEYVARYLLEREPSAREATQRLVTLVRRRFGLR
jgi:SAM-dependent methyltransferase